MHSPAFTEEPDQPAEPTKMSTSDALFAKLNSVFDEQNSFEDHKPLKYRFFKRYLNFEEIAAKREDYAILIFHKDNG